MRRRWWTRVRKEVMEWEEVDEVREDREWWRSRKEEARQG